MLLASDVKPRRRLSMPASADAARMPGAGFEPANFGWLAGHTHVMDAVPDPEPAPGIDWRLHGVRVVRGDELDPNTPQTPGMNRAAAITYARAGAEKLWAGTVVIHANAKTGAHHHGPVESVIYVVKGKARMRWGDHLEFTAEAGPGDFIYVPPYVPHQEINASRDELLECVLLRSGQDPVVVNLYL